jgi:general secretion pathway protein L
MDDTLLIHFNPSRAQASWALVNAAGELSCKISTGDLAEASALASTHRSVVLLDNILVHINSVQLPTQNRQKMLRAIPFALEEQIADDIEEFHFVAAKSDKNNNTAVAGIRTETLQSILDQLAEHKIKPDAIIPDALCLAGTTSQWSILLYQDIADIQLDVFNGAEYDRELVPLILESSLHNEAVPKPEKILLFSLDNDNVDDIRAVIPDDIELVQIHYNQHPLVVYCGQYKSALALNLLQGDFKPKSKTASQWKRWQLPASLAAVWLILNLSVTGYQYQHLSSKNSEMQSQIIKLYKESFPENTRIVDARKQMERNLNELKSGSGTGGDDMLKLLAYAADALSKDKSIILQSIDYRDKHIDINLTTTQLSAIQTLNNNLNKTGKLKSEIISSTSDKNIVKGSLRLQSAGA